MWRLLNECTLLFLFFFSSRRRHTRLQGDWSSDVCSSDLFASDLMPDLAGGLVRKDFRIANAWAVKSDQMIDSSGVKFPAYFLSADIIAPNGEAVPGTWVTTQITKPGLIWAVSPQAKKDTSWAKAGDSSTAGIAMETPGAKESVACVLEGRATTPKAGVVPKATTP